MYPPPLEKASGRTVRIRWTKAAQTPEEPLQTEGELPAGMVDRFKLPGDAQKPPHLSRPGKDNPARARIKPARAGCSAGEKE